MRASQTLLRNSILVGDATEQLASIPDRSVDMVLTSPPYFRLRDYQVDGQLGLEDHVDQWVAGLVAVCAEAARVLTPTGTLWLNVADSYSTHLREGAPRKSLLGGPERLTLALLADGWTLRNKIVWAKTNPMPSPVRDRLSCTWEIVLVLTRSPKYFFDLDAIREPHRSIVKVGSKASADFLPPEWRGPNGDTAAGLAALKAQGIVGHPLGKNPGDVWQIATASYRGAHFATFPVRLAERAIRAGCPEARCQSCRAPWRRPVVRELGATATRSALSPTCPCPSGREPGLVLDPFMGAGTTAVAAQQLGRDWLGVELNPEFAMSANERITKTTKNGMTVMHSSPVDGIPKQLTRPRQADPKGGDHE